MRTRQSRFDGTRVGPLRHVCSTKRSVPTDDDTDLRSHGLFSAWLAHLPACAFPIRARSDRLKPHDLQSDAVPEVISINHWFEPISSLTQLGDALAKSPDYLHAD